MDVLCLARTCAHVLGEGHSRSDSGYDLLLLCFAKDFPASSGIWYQLPSRELCAQAEPPPSPGVSLVTDLRGDFSGVSWGLVESS